MIFEMDYKEVKELEGGQQLDPGSYECKCIASKWGRTKNSKLYLQLTWESGEPETKGMVAYEKKWFPTEAPKTEEEKDKLVMRMGFMKAWSHSACNIIMDSKSINEKVYVGRFANVTIVEKHNLGYEKPIKDVASMQSQQYHQHNTEISAGYGADNQTPSSIKQDESSQNNSSNNDHSSQSNSSGYDDSSNYQQSDDMDDLPF